MAELIKGIVSILKSLEKPYLEYNSPENMTEYTQIIEDGHYIYGKPHITKDNVSPFSPYDVRLVALDENGKPLPLKFPYYINPFGDKYRLNKKNEKIFESKNECKRYILTLLDDSTRNFSRIIYSFGRIILILIRLIGRSFVKINVIPKRKKRVTQKSTISYKDIKDVILSFWKLFHTVKIFVVVKCHQMVKMRLNNQV